MREELRKERNEFNLFFMTAQQLPLVLLPGKLCDRRLWKYQIEYLSKNTEVLVIDLSQCSTLDAMISEVSIQSPARFALGGFSMGGYVAIEYVLREAHRVERLALIGSSSRGYDTATR